MVWDLNRFSRGQLAFGHLRVVEAQVSREWPPCLLCFQWRLSVITDLKTDITVCQTVDDTLELFFCPCHGRIAKVWGECKETEGPALFVVPWIISSTYLLFLTIPLIPLLRATVKQNPQQFQ